MLDPACGTGNFLYVTLDLFKRLESEVLALLAGLGFEQVAPQLERYSVTPEQFRGIEVKPWAKEIAELVLWIGYLQWQVRQSRGGDDDSGAGAARLRQHRMPRRRPRLGRRPRARPRRERQAHHALGWHELQEVRWLRPEFQNPGGAKAPAQAELPDAASRASARAGRAGAPARSEKRPRPKELPAQVAAVRDLLGEMETLDLSSAKSAFRRAQKDALLAALESLAALGLAVGHGEGAARSWSVAR